MSTYNLIAIKYRKKDSTSLMRTEFSMNQLQEAKDFQAKLVSEGAEIVYGYEHIVTIEHGGGEVARTNYENLGDVNPIEHGGFFISEDFDREKCFHVVVIDQLPDSENSWLLKTCFIDMNDVSKDDIANATDDRDENNLSDKDIIFDLVLHYGVNHFYSPDFKIIEGEENVIKELNSYNILV